MSSSRRAPITNEYYHIFNRGVDKRKLFNNLADLDRFITCLREFNRIDPVGSLSELPAINSKSGPRAQKKNKEPLVEIIAFCINPNHYHLLAKQLVDNGLSEYIKRVSAGYTGYFNLKYRRSGALFQGKYKHSHVDDNNYMLHLSAYINLNSKVHAISSRDKHLTVSSFKMYTEDVAKPTLECSPDIVLSQFKSKDEYRNFATESLELMLERKKDEKELKALLHE